MEVPLRPFEIFRKPRDCYDVYDHFKTRYTVIMISGKYTVYLDKLEFPENRVDVYCDASDGGGWLVV